MIFYIDILYLFLFYLCRSTRIPLVQVTLFFCCCCRSGGRRSCCCGLNDRIILLYFPLVSLLFAVSTAAPTNRFAVAWSLASCSLAVSFGCLLTFCRCSSSGWRRGCWRRNSTGTSCLAHADLRLTTVAMAYCLSVFLVKSTQFVPVSSTTFVWIWSVTLVPEGFAACSGCLSLVALVSAVRYCFVLIKNLATRLAVDVHFDLAVAAFDEVLVCGGEKKKVEKKKIKNKLVVSVLSLCLFIFSFLSFQL